MIRVVTAKRLRQLEAAKVERDQLVAQQQQLWDQLGSMSRSERRRAWRDLWSSLPETDEA